jgi:DNA-binding response OmpR family regulator
MGGLILDTQEHTCRHGETELTLTGKEFSLLKELMKAANKVLTREELMNSVWGYDFIGESERWTFISKNCVKNLFPPAFRMD